MRPLKLKSKQNEVLFHWLGLDHCNWWILKVWVVEIGWVFSDFSVGCLHKAGGVEWCLSNPPLLSVPFLTIPFFPHPCPLLPSSLLPSTFNPSLSNSLLLIANASSPQLPPADAYTLPRSYIHALIGSQDATLQACDIQKWRCLQSPRFELSRASAQSSTPFFQEQGWGWNGGGLDSLPPYVSHSCQLSKDLKRCSKVQCFVWAQPTSVWLMSWFLTWMKGLGLELESCCTDF